MDSPGGKPFVLFCAGEDSGDILGESFVREAVEAGWGACGAGGRRMDSAGLNPLVNFEHLPVSGFGDVLASCGTLRKDFEVLRSALCSPQCLALVAIDYPGFNMKLVRLAKRLGKPVLYVAPPQIWAWKPGRAKQLRGVPLAVFFDFEVDAYRKHGCEAQLMRHPLALAQQPARQPVNSEVLLLPGSRLAQAKRNIRTFLKPAIDLAYHIGGGKSVTILAARESLCRPFTEIVDDLALKKTPCEVNVEVIPASTEERLERYSRASLALVCPGTATLEVALAATPMVICTKPDLLTYALGKLLVRSKSFGLPNLIAGESFYGEFIAAPFANSNDVAKCVLDACQKAVSQSSDAVRQTIKSKLSGGKPARELMLEFLGQFVERKSH